MPGVDELAGAVTSADRAGQPSIGLRNLRQNRVTPLSEIIAVSERGTLMGNRGILHDENGHIRRCWQGKRWITCTLSFRGRKRTVMSPGKYTELFFLDEATALAAGHRPCAECRRTRFVEFCKAWRTAVREGETASEIDSALHRDRVGDGRSKRVFRANLDDLPDGVFVITEVAATPQLLWEGHLLHWSPGGYRERLARPTSEEVSVLTPNSTVEAIRAGYVPGIHDSARST